MAHTSPVSLFGRSRLHVYGPDTTTDRGVIYGQGVTGKHSKVFGESGLTLTASIAETILAADEDIMADAFVVPEVYYLGSWTPFATPYLLAPGSFTVREGDSRRTQSPVAVSALHGLLEECEIFPTEADADHATFRKGGGEERNRYFHFASKGYSETLHTWHAADIYTPGTGTLVGTATVAAATDTFTLTAHGLADDDRVRFTITSGAVGLSETVAYVVSVTDANTFTVSSADTVEVTSDGTVEVYSGIGKKFGKPDDMPEALAAAAWVYRNAAEGGRTCARFGNFTLTEDQRVVFIYCSDENGKVFLDGPNQGGVVIDWDADEDGYNQGFGHKTKRLKAGTYSVGAHMLSINSEGGDGNDAMIFGCYSIKTDGSGDVDQVLLMSGSSTKVLRQQISDQIPGMSPGETMRRALQTNADLGSDAATLLLANRTFTDALDTDLVAWPSSTCVEWVWPMGTSLASAFTDLLAEIDLDMGPTFSFDAWADRGSNLSAAVALTPGADPPTTAMNIKDYSGDSDPAGPNAYLTESQEGFGLYEGTLAAGQRRRFGFLESGSSGSVGRANRNARKAVKANGEARRYFHATLLAVTGAAPWGDFTLCDVVNGRDHKDQPLDVEVTELGWVQGDNTKVTATMAEPAP